MSVKITPENWREMFINQGLEDYVRMADEIFDEFEHSAQGLEETYGFDSETAGHVSAALSWMYINYQIHSLGMELDG